MPKFGSPGKYKRGGGRNHYQEKGSCPYKSQQSLKISEKSVEINGIYRLP